MKAVIVVALGIALGWVGLHQLQRAEIDNDVASVSRAMANNPVKLPNLSTPLPGFEPAAPQP